MPILVEKDIKRDPPFFAPDNQTLEISPEGLARVKDLGITLEKLGYGIIPVSPIELSSGRNLFLDSPYTIGKVILRFPTVISGEVVFATDNVAKGKTITSNATVTNPSYATDENFDTYAAIDPISGGEYMVIDLGEEATYFIDTSYYIFSSSVSLEISSDGENYKLLLNVAYAPGVGGMRTYTGVHTFRYIRLEVYSISSSPAYLRWHELTCWKTFIKTSNVKSLVLTPSTYQPKQYIY
jgi:hypothetical protein